ncbi:MAG: phospholipase D-like domain-containing protein [Chloroflexi bacterium]|nr:phospholipase D-like domain-containing protein [Chloroflexota bacterium]
MKRFIVLFFAICIVTIACGGSYTATPLPPTKVPPKVSATAAPSTAAPALTEIPMRVGYGVSGSWFELYFTDPTNPAAKQKTGGPDGPLAAAIDSARLSVDLAIYSFNLKSVRDALLRAHRRGVQVRVVMESDNMDRAVPQALKDAGIPVLGDRREGLMHDKFMVIDQSKVWTGSMNFTDTGTYNDNSSLMLIRSTKVAADYTTEFNEMFVDDKFGKDVVAATPNPHVTIDGTRLDIYFSPDDNIQTKLAGLLNNAQSSIYFLAYSFTANSLGNVIRQKAAAGVTVAGVMETDQVKSNVGTEFDPFRAAGLNVKRDGNSGLMHHKVMIIDNQIVVMGSYNFSVVVR